MCIECRLGGVEPATQHKWSQNAICRFRQLLGKNAINRSRLLLSDNAIYRTFRSQSSLDPPAALGSESCV